MVRVHLYEVPRVVKFIQRVEGRRVVARGWGDGRMGRGSVS